MRLFVTIFLFSLCLTNRLLLAFLLREIKTKTKRGREGGRERERERERERPDSSTIINLISAEDSRTNEMPAHDLATTRRHTFPDIFLSRASLIQSPRANQPSPISSLMFARHFLTSNTPFVSTRNFSFFFSLHPLVDCWKKLLISPSE